MIERVSFFKRSILFVISYLIVAFSQPAWIGSLGYLAYLGGYLLFWLSIYNVDSRKKRFWVSFLWFFSVQLIQLSWFTSTKYQGYLILIAYVFLATLLGIEFALLTLLIRRKHTLSILRILAICSLWVLFEYSRLYILCGFSFNQIGLAMANNHLSMQIAAIAGIFGMSFWVMMINLIGYKAIIQRSYNVAAIWIVLAFVPYLFGFFNQVIHQNEMESKDKISTILVQTALKPEQKGLMSSYLDDFISPLYQWKRIISFIKKEAVNKNIDLIVLPEAALPYGAYNSFYPLEMAKHVLKGELSEQVITSLPEIKEPYAENIEGRWYISNSFFTQAISNYYNAEVVIGLDDESYNAAFYFQPNQDIAQRYEKRILVPIGEYFPFPWLKDFAAKRYGIQDAFVRGTSTKVFSGKVPFSVSICYEETYSNLMHQARKKGANLFVNVTNDGWFFNSKLFRQHFHHSKIRSVENGVSLIRACNTGVTSGIDPFGRVIKSIDSETKATALHLMVSSFSYATLYSFWGDYFIIGICIIFIGVFIFKSRYSKIELAQK